MPDFDINYGWGERIQLKHELPIALKHELPIAATTDRNNTTRAGLGQSLLGVKWRPYEHHRSGEAKSDENMDFSLGTYPQASVNNPTSSVRRGVVESGPQYYLPLEATAKWGPISFNGEVGRWFGNRNVPSRWGRGLIAGHEFSERLKIYGEIYDLQDANRMANTPIQRELTLDLGGRKSLDRRGCFRLLLMGGRGIVTIAGQNNEPNWIAYLGIHMLLGPER